MYGIVYYSTLCFWVQKKPRERRKTKIMHIKKENVGIALFSRAVASQVFSAPKSLTTVFGMGTGGTSSS